MSVWKKKFKGDDRRGGAWIHTREGLSRAIVENHRGVVFDGQGFPSVKDAKNYADAMMEARK